VPDAPKRGDVWYVDLEPVRGHEQGRIRPALIISADIFNAGPAELVIVVPITTADRRIPTHVQIDPPEGGLTRRSFVKAEDIRSISTLRLQNRVGRVDDVTLRRVEDALIILLDLQLR
jgi:mRNA interferase MazF